MSQKSLKEGKVSVSIKGGAVRANSVPWRVRVSSLRHSNWG